MQINLAVERLVLEGFDIPRHHHALILATVEAELVRLLAMSGLAANVSAPVDVPRVAGGPLGPAASDPIALGRQIAAAVYAGIGPSPAAEEGAR